MPQTPNEIAEIRSRFIDSQQDQLETIGKRLQQKLFDALLNKFISEFTLDNGRITDNGQNIRLTAALDKIFQEFINNDQLKFISMFIDDIQKITDLNLQYYRSLDIAARDRMNQIEEQVRKVMEFRLGINPDGTLTKKGFLDSFVRDTQLRESVRNTVLQSVTRHVPMNDLILNLKLNILGAQGLDGAIVRQYKDFIFDTYQQHDRATTKFIANDLKLTDFIYAGGLIDTSRLFCEKRNGLVFTVDEAQEWINDPDLPRTKEERKAGKILNYDPLIDCGRWRCRHHTNFITKAMADRRRRKI